MIHDFDGNVGVARQGDLLIFKLPASIKVTPTNEMSPRDGRLVLLEGEMTGHHHSVDVIDGPVPVRPTEDKIKPRKTNKTVEDIFSAASAVTAPVVKMFRDTSVPDQLVNAKILTRKDLYIGTLQIEGGGDVGVILKHQEHDGIRLKQGNYYVGRQIESAGAEERMVAD